MVLPGLAASLSLPLPRRIDWPMVCPARPLLWHLPSKLPVDFRTAICLAVAAETTSASWSIELRMNLGTCARNLGRRRYYDHPPIGSLRHAHLLKVVGRRRADRNLQSRET